jgi:hypothetical protein
MALGMDKPRTTGGISGPGGAKVNPTYKPTGGPSTFGKVIGAIKKGFKEKPISTTETRAFTQYLEQQAKKAAKKEKADAIANKIENQIAKARGINRNKK